MKIDELVTNLVNVADDKDFREWEQEIVKRLSAEIPHYSWVGFYWVKGEMLHLGAWEGPEATEHTEIPIGQGICGLAARTRETVIIDDVNARDDYLACFPYTKSEIVVPILRDGEAIGEIDIDGDNPGAFTEEDRIELERLAAAIAERYPE